MFDFAKRTAFPLILVSLALLASAYTGSTRTENSQSDKPIKIGVSRQAGRTVYKIDSKPVLDPLRSLEELYGTHGGDAEVWLLFELDTSLRDVYEGRGLTSKAGFRKIRAFANNPTTGFMSEITFGTSINSQ